MQNQRMVPLSLALLLCFFASIKAQGAGDINLGPANYTCITGGAEPHPDLCNQYYTCWTHPISLWQCRDNLLFDLTYSGCNWPATVNCGSRRRPDQPTTTVKPTIPPPTFQCPSSEGLFPAEAGNRCLSTYYMCVGNVSYAQACPGNTVFDTNTCKTPESADCQVASTTTASPEFICPTTGEDDYYPSPTSCTHFYRCIEGTPYPQTCPPSLVYNPDAKMCDWPVNVPSCSSSRALKKTRSNGFSCPEPNGNFNDPADCNRYYVCIDDTPVGNICPPGLYFDAANNVCNYAALVKCDANKED